MFADRHGERIARLRHAVAPDQEFTRRRIERIARDPNVKRYSDVEEALKELKR